LERQGIGFKTRRRLNLRQVVRRCVEALLGRSSLVSRPVLDLPRERAPGRHAGSGPAEDSPGLTRRELEILQLVEEGHSNAELARTLWVTEQTVKFHLSNIYRKLDVSNRTEASRWAQLRGLLIDPAVTAST
jgi:DNA-binding CsgD family transcriptional regulator